MRGYQYQFLDDSLFELLPSVLTFLIRENVVIASDIVRLMTLQRYIADGYQTVVWLDADTLIYDTEFNLTQYDACFGREVWLQKDAQGNVKTYKKIHNAFMQFSQKNTVLDFYASCAASIASKYQNNMPSQVVGPKLLTALHNIVGFHVHEQAAVFSPLVIHALLKSDADILNLFQQQSELMPQAVNLCASSCSQGQVSDTEMHNVITHLMQHGYRVRR